MFTGLIETVDKIKNISQRRNHIILSITSSFVEDDLNIGDSIACDGVCLTVISFDKKIFTVEVSQETAGRTIMNNYRINSTINIERAVRAGDRLGGHLVSGHIDDVGVIEQIKPVGESIKLKIKYHSKYNKLIVEKGSVAVNGISLTVNETGDGWFIVNIIPHTIKTTNLQYLKSKDSVNLEFDIIGKYLAKMYNNSNKLTKEKLIESGW
ncbi:MAG: riboflavin synthase [Candidatus Zixiibacteriota bacterium]